MKRRMHNIFNKDGLSFVMAIDHAAMMKSPDLDHPEQLIGQAVTGGVDAFLTTFGMVKTFSKAFSNTGIILRADGGISTLKKPMDSIDCLYGAEDALRIGADAMLCMGYPGSVQNEHSLKYLAKLAADCEKWNLPLGAEMLPYGFENTEGSRSIENICFASRQGAELGADFIKTEYVGGEEFRKVVDSTYAPVMVLGGAAAKSERELLENVRNALDCGAKGVIMGRNIYRRKHITGICRAIAAVIHGGEKVDDAMQYIKQD